MKFIIQLLLGVLWLYIMALAVVCFGILGVIGLIIYPFILINSKLYKGNGQY
jgi:hypothetical protein